MQWKQQNTMQHNTIQEKVDDDNADADYFVF